MKKIFLFTMTSIALLLITAQALWAQKTWSFDEIWASIKVHSPEIMQSAHEYEAARISHTRSKRHWFPQAQLQANAYRTNDPGKTLFSNLGNREVNAGDFNPSVLNYPGYGNFAQSSVLVNLPLFEGGMKVESQKGLGFMKEAREYGLKFTKNYQYTQAAMEYSLLLGASQHVRRIRSLQGELATFLNDYELGSPQNPIGHTGLLGLRSLSNRLKAMKNQTQTEMSSFKTSLTQKADIKSENWDVKPQSIHEFLKSRFGKIMKQNEASLPASVKATQMTAHALSKFSNAERSKFLPHIGVFNQTDLNVGTRDNANSNTVGGYLQWNILSPTEYGSVKEKKMQALAMKNQASAQALKSKVDVEQSYDGIVSTVENLRLMSSSLSLLREQTKTSRSLYQSGLINILQMLEHLNRRADLLEKIHQGETYLSYEYARNYLQRSHDNER